ncbi:hypothetical protein ABK040_005500 [Willaertia magna]
MTDFLNSSYGNRCQDSYREWRREAKRLQKEEKELTTSHPLYLKFQTCLYRPFLNLPEHTDLRNKLNNCLEINQDYTKCIPEINKLRSNGIKQTQELVYFDAYNTVKVQNASNQCKDYFNKARDLACDAYPEKHECVELKEKSFSCIARTSCTEIYHMSNDCFKENERMAVDSIWRYLFKGQDSQTKQAHEKHCHHVQSDLIRCFDKYFLLGLVMRPVNQSDESNGNFYGPITPELLKEREKEIERKLKRDREQANRFREQQNNE